MAASVPVWNFPGDKWRSLFLRWFHDSPPRSLFCPFLSLCFPLFFPSSPSGPLYGSLMRAWQCFFTSTERLSALHSSISQSLVAEEGERVKTWQKETFPRKLFCGFRESHDNRTSFTRAQKPWSKKLKKVQPHFSFTYMTCFSLSPGHCAILCRRTSLATSYKLKTLTLQLNSHLPHKNVKAVLWNIGKLTVSLHS